MDREVEAKLRGKMVAVMEAYTALFQRLTRGSAQDLLEQFGFVHAIADGALRGMQMDVRGTYVIDSDAGANDPPSVAQSLHLQRELIDLLGRCDERALKELSSCVHVVEAAARGMFRANSLFFGRNKVLVFSYQERYLESRLSEAGLLRGGLAAASGKTLEFIRKNAPFKNMRARCVSSLVSAASIRLEHPDMGSLLGSLSLTPANVQHAVEFMALTSPSPKEGWHQRKVTIMVPGTVVKTRVGHEALMLTWHNDRGNRFFAETVAVDPSCVDQWFEGGIGQGRYVLAVESEVDDR